MGWTGIPNKPRNPKEYVATNLCSWSNEDSVGRPLKIMNYGNTYYVAVEATPKDGNPQVFAAIILTRTDRDGWWYYKDMDETMGPVESQCPKTILNLLSPTTSDYAQQWRERCHQWHRRPRPKIGDKVRLREPWEPYGSEFIKVKWHHTNGVYQSVKTGHHVRLRTAEIAEIINP